ncbi:MAG: Maf family protein [Tepidanaerobacteraceae bacterium]|jgi:septum formation protein|nr:septum formation protein Maf [Thermoanaerobacterales bacterium]
MERKLILASSSPRRQQLLNQIGLDFTVEPSNLNEDFNRDLDFGPFASEIAFKKSAAVAKRHKEGLVLGADTIVVCNRKILGKPATPLEAKEMLSMLSGRWHQVFTGLSLVDVSTGSFLKDFEESWVKFKDIDSNEIENYIKTGEPMDKAGAYGIQERGALFVEKISGDYYNIVGLPLFKLNLMLLNFNIRIL